MRRVYRSLFRYKQKGFASLVQHEYLWKQDQGCSLSTAQTGETKENALKKRRLSFIVESRLQQTLNTPNDSLGRLCIARTSESLLKETKWKKKLSRSLRGPLLPRLRNQLKLFHSRNGKSSRVISPGSPAEP